MSVFALICSAITPLGTNEIKEDIPPGLEKPEIGTTEHTGIYSTSGFDVLGALVRTVPAGKKEENLRANEARVAWL